MVDVNFGALRQQTKDLPFGVLPPLNRLNLLPALPYYTMVQPYAVVTVDLSVARSVPTSVADALTLIDGTVIQNWAANSLVLMSLTANATAYFAVGDPLTVPGSSGNILSVATARMEGIPFTKLYVQNGAQAGDTAQFVLSWVDS